MYQRYQQLSPLAAFLRKTGAVLVLVFFWLLLAFALPAQVAAQDDPPGPGCRYIENGNRWECPEEATPDPTPDPPPPTPDPPTQPEKPQQPEQQQNIQRPPLQASDNNIGVNRNPDGAADNSRDSASRRCQFHTRLVGAFLHEPAVADPGIPLFAGRAMPNRQRRWHRRSSHPGRRSPWRGQCLGSGKPASRCLLRRLWQDRLPERLDYAAHPADPACVLPRWRRHLRLHQ